MKEDRSPASVRRMSLAGKLSFLISSLVVSVVMVGLILFCLLTYRNRVKERRDNLQAIAATVAKLIARPLSLGDYASVEVYLSARDFPPFIRALSVRGPAGELLAGPDWSGAHGRAAAAVLTDTVTVPVGSPTSPGAGAPSLSVAASVQDLRAAAVVMAASALGIGLLLVLGIVLLSRLSVRWAFKPLKAAVDMGASNPDLDVAMAAQAPEEIRPLLIRISSLYRESSKIEAAARVGALASQVAHDIRSPLAALEVATEDVSQFPEESRIIIRGAIGRIRDIANDLLDESRVAGKGRPEGRATSQTEEPPSTCLLSSLIDPLISEKRLSFRERPGVAIVARSAAASYGVFAEVQPAGFKRVLSNLINNAMEALGSRGGVVSVRLAAEGESVHVTVEDSGHGIPHDRLSTLCQRGATFGKPGGTGLGLWHAKTTIESWGGCLEIASEVGKGTTVRLILPRAETPAWFCPQLVLRPGQTAVVLDDEGSIHALWDKRLAETGAKVLHARSPEEFRALAAPPDALYLLDHQLSGRPETGLSLAQERGVAARAVLVTGRHDDPALQAECLRLGVRIVPKELAAYVPIRIATPAAAPDAVLIDDDPLVRMNWSLAAKRAGKALSAYADAASFIREADGLSKHVPIYVDSHLGDGLKGEEAALDLSRRGFTELHLETGHDPASFGPLAHIRSVRGKEPPWPAS